MKFMDADKPRQPIHALCGKCGRQMCNIDRLSAPQFQQRLACAYCRIAFVVCAVQITDATEIDYPLGEFPV